MKFQIHTQNGFSFKGVPAGRLLAPLSVALLAACGGGGGAADTGSAGSSTPNPVAPTSLAAGTLYAGPVSGLGSIVVNGIRFETVGAQVLDADDPYGTTKYTDPIRLGTIVAVEGATDESKGTGTASRIRIDGGMRGQVGAIDTTASTLSVNGQTVKVGSSTLIQGASGLAGIAAASWVEVYGLAQSDGSFVATRIEVYGSRTDLESSYPKASTYPVVLRGIVGASTPGSFTLPDARNVALSVNYSAANVLPAGATIVAGSSVRVLANSAPVGNGPLIAAKVLVLNPSNLLADSSAASSIKLKGVVDSLGADTLVVSGTTVDISAAVKPALAIAKNQVVEVKGTLSNGTLVASKLEFEDKQTSYTAQPGQASTSVSYQQELYGLISGYDAAKNTFVVQGVTVQASSATRFEYGYSKLANDVYAEIKGTLQNGVLQASKVEIKGVTASAVAGDASAASSDSARASSDTSGLSGGASRDASAASGGASANSGIDDALGKSSGGTSFEIYGALTCSNYPSACTINSGVNSVNTNLAAAQWEKGSYAANSFVEAKGVLNSAGVFQVTKIEIKR